MSTFAGSFIICHPSLHDAQATLDLVVASEVAEYGEPDSSLEDLLAQWSDIDLERNAWLVITPQNQIIGYAAVLGGSHRFTFDFSVHPALAPDGLTEYLLTQCEARARELLEVGFQATASIIISPENLVNRQIAEKLGFKPCKYHYRMQITLDAPPPVPDWPEGISVRTAVAGQDDRPIFNLIQAAFDRPGRVPPSFERWHDIMMGAYNFEIDLWILAYHGGDLIGAALCFDYPQNGWVRQLGVAQPWRRQGIGSALLQHVFGIFYERGHTRVGLGVESENPDAFHLYESVGMKCIQQYAEYCKTLSNA
jgi:mycothiol synthase